VPLQDLLIPLTGRADLQLLLIHPPIYISELLSSRFYCGQVSSVLLQQSISQTLIIRRITGFSRLRASTSAAKRTALVFASDYHRAVEVRETISSMLDRTKGSDDIEMCTTCSRILA
jgi:hypothetical protein